MYADFIIWDSNPPLYIGEKIKKRIIAQLSLITPIKGEIQNISPTHSVPTFRYPSGHWQVKAPTELMHSWLGWQSCSCLSHSSMSVFVGVVIQTFKTLLLWANTPSCSMTDIYSVSVTCHWPLRSPYLHPAAENIMLSHVCCVMQATFSLQVLKHSSCPRVKSSKFLHCLPASRGLMLTHTLTDCTHMLPPVLTPVAATCPSQSVAANNEFTQPHTHTNMLNNRYSCGHLSTSNPQTNKPDTHPHSCFPEARSLEGMGLRAQRV